MKRVVLSLSLFFFVFTLSYAFHPESLVLSQVINHQHNRHDDNQIKPASGGSDSPNILLPTKSSTGPDHTESLPVVYEEAVSEPENPAQMRNMFTFPVYRLKRFRCRQVSRFMRHPRPVNELGFDPVLTYVIRNRDVSRDFLEAIRMFDQNYMMQPLHRPRHHHRDDHHHDHDEEDDDDDDDDDDQLVEMKEEDQDEEERENGLKKKRKEKVDDDEEREHEDKQKDELKKKRKEEDDDEHEDHKERHKKKRKEKDRDDHDDDDDEHEDEGNMEKYVMKKIRKFMNFF